MDRDRLESGLRTSDVNESKYNEGFVEWLKTSGMNILLVAILMMLAYLLYIRYQRGQDERRIEAWSSLSSASLPQSLEDVAAEPAYAKIDQVANLARAQAAEQYLSAVIRGRRIAAADLDLASGVEPEPLDDATRDDYLARAEAAYRAILETDDGSEGMTLHAWMAECGIGAIAEARGDAAAAATAYEAAAERARDFYADLAIRARARAATASDFAEPVSLPTPSQVTAMRAGAASTRPTPVRVLPSLEAIIDPAAAAADAANGG